MNPIGVIVIIHRYLGLAVGLLMVLWCLSGFVMMYQSYPELTGEERLAGLAPLQLDGCCDLSGVDLGAIDPVDSFRVEMLAGAPVLRISSAEGPRIYDLAAGREIEAIGEDDVRAVAEDWGRGHRIDSAPALTRIERDQWSVQLASRHQPIYRAAFGDGARTEIYVSGRTGEVIQDTTGKERVLGWLGAVPHWLYPAILRQNGPLWVQIVIWTSVVGTFLTLTGVYVGISRWAGAPKGRITPFKGLWMWHHMIGLVFGVLVLTWVVSGLLSMNPWGLLSGGGSAAPGEYEGEVTWTEVEQFLTAAPALAGGGAVLLTSMPLGGALVAGVVGAAGAVVRVGADGAHAPLGGAEVEAALAGVSAPVRDLVLLQAEDAYYYGHHGEVDLPVYRAILDDEESTRLYLSARTGQIARVVGASRRQYRWWQSGLHDFDFPVLRTRPVWDLVVLPLLAGVTAVCVTGFWLALKRAGRDIRFLRTLLSRRRRRHAPAAAADRV
jgi:hypothetical protein